MVALCLNGETVVKGMIRPLFTSADGQQTWIGEPLPSHAILSLRSGAYDCTKSTFSGFVSAEGGN